LISVVYMRGFLAGVVLSMAALWGGSPDDGVELEQTGFIKSADQPIPGATVSATQGTTIVTTSSD